MRRWAYPSSPVIYRFKSSYKIWLDFCAIWRIICAACKKDWRCNPASVLTAATFEVAVVFLEVNRGCGARISTKQDGFACLASIS